MKQKLRFLEQKIFQVLMTLSVLIVIGALLFIVGTVLFKGLPSLSLDMITKTPKGGFYLGREGGILNALAGSFYLGIGATALAALLGVPIVIYLHMYTRNNALPARIIRLTLNILWGIPSIVYGAFGFILMLFLGVKVSLLAGIIVVSLIILPIMVRTMDETVKTIPRDLFEALSSLGATPFEAARVILFRRALPGVLTALLIGFGRAIGDAAAVLFTTGYTDNIPGGLGQPAATLPLAIFFQLSSPIPEVRDRAYAAALILTLLVLFISQSARLLSRRTSKHISP